MQLTPRQRGLLVCLVMVVLGVLSHQIFDSVENSLDCTSSIVRTLHACSFGSRHLNWARLILAALLTAVLLVVIYLLVRWVMRPVGGLTEMIDRMGPQNLAERGELGPEGDDLTKLTASINAMLERVAAGYEGQRSFAANASHELRTPLAVQRTLIEVSMAEARTPKQLELLTKQLLATNERNERLIEGLLVLSESDRGLSSRTPQQLDEIVATVIDTHRDMAAQSGVTVRTELAPRLVEGERVLLERLVTNLVRNAIAYNLEGGEVMVRVAAHPALVVENTGAAIAADAVDGLFEPFKRGTADRTHHGGGAGLGLTIVRSISRAHDGSVAARPGPQGGLRVEVDLP
jgi:signal transduction histidine kinase